MEKENRTNVFLKFGELLGYEVGIPPSPRCSGLIGKKLKESGLTNEEFYKILLEKEEYLKDAVR